jgi:hypothetical protein
MKSFIILPVFYFFLVSATAQQKTSKKTNPYRYIITESKINETDNTAFDLDREGFLTFINLEDTDDLYLVNDSKVYDTFSYGPISKIERKETFETNELFASDTFIFKWHFRNSYDEKSGYASVKFIRIFKPQGTIFSMYIVLPNLDLIEYSGYIEGSVNFDRLN